MSQPWTPGGSGIWCDLYELTMAVGYLEHGVTGEAVFSLYVRDLPPDRGYLVVGGVDDAVDAVCDLGFSHEDLAWLRGIGLTSAATNRLAGLRFTGEVRAVPEGRVVTAGEPIIEVRAPIAEAQLAETLVLNQLTYQTTIATKLARCIHAAQDRIELVDFAFRRAHGVEAALSVARLAGIVGFTGTSNVPAARLYGMRPVGTMAHSFIEAFPTERDAFRAYAATFPERTTFLVDTYDTLEGVDRAVDVIKEAGLVHNVAVRLDSGDLGGLARAARARLDEAGLHRVRIFASGGIDEHALARLVAAAAPVDSAGVGTKVGVAADAPYLDTVYKLVSYEGRPVRKLSTGKASMPGAKQVWRPVPLLADAAAAARAAAGPGGAAGDAVEAGGPRRERRHRPGDGPEPGVDVVTEREELVDGAEPLLVPVVTRGRRVVERSTPAAARRRFQADLAALPAPALDLRHPRPLTARFSDALLRLADEADRSHAAAEARRAPG